MKDTPLHVRSSCRIAAAWLLIATAAAPAWSQGRQALVDARNKMVDEEIVGAGVKNPKVIAAMRKTPRHEFVPPPQRAQAYLDMGLPIGEGQTISAPFIVAYMTETIDPQPTDTVLEIGTGSGYQAAVLSPLVKDVYTIEIVESLGLRAEKVLGRLRYENVHVKVGDGYKGWPEHAPFDKIIVTCSPEEVPPALTEQLKEGGRMIIPVGQRYQQTLVLLKKVKGKMESETLLPTLFVPMTGAAESKRQVKPDPANPTLENGDFEDAAGDPPTLAGWHYQRQVSIGTGAAPSGKNYAAFRNAQAGRGCQMLQGFGVDGRKVAQLNVTLKVRARNARAGQNSQQSPGLGITFYGENRNTIAHVELGPWLGTFDWETEKKRIEVPLRAREAVLHVGLLGAIGEIDVDAIEMRAVKR